MPPLQLRDYLNKRRVLANVHLELAPGFTLEMRFPVTHGFTSDHSAARAGVADVTNAPTFSPPFAFFKIGPRSPRETNVRRMFAYALPRFGTPGSISRLNNNPDDNLGLNLATYTKRTRSARDVIKTNWMLEQLKYTLTHTSLLRANANGLKLDGQERRGEGRGGDEDVRREPQGADDAQPQSHVATFMHLRASRATCWP